MRIFSFILLLCFSSSFLTKAQKAIDVTVYGSGDPVLLLPGFATNHEVFDQTINQLKSTYEIHAVDYAGFGNVEPVSFPWLPQIQQQLLIYLKNVDSDKITIIGHSMGGTLALWLSAQSELNVSKVIVIDGLPATGALMFPDYKPENIVYDSPYSTQQLEMNDEQFLGMATMMAGGMATAQDDQKTIINGIMKSDRETYVKGYVDYLKLDVRPELSNIKAQVYVLCAAGMYGEAMARKTYTDQLANLSDYTIDIHPTSKHFIMLDAADWYLDQLSTRL